MKSKRIINIFISILLIIAVLSGGILVAYGYSLKQASNEFEELGKAFQVSQTKVVKTKKDKAEEPAGPDELIEEEVPDLSLAFEELFNQNNDIIAWISIPGTGVNYPLMHTPDQPEYYLYRNFKEEYSLSGVPFIDGKSSLEAPTDNLLIHGHNMKNGSMFAQLLAYQDQDFLKQHPSIELYSFDGKQIYDIISIFPTAVYKNEGSNFNYHDFIQAKDEEEFDRYMAKAKEFSLFDTGLGAQYGDQLMTLSTCAYHTANGRFVVIAKARED